MKIKQISILVVVFLIGLGLGYIYPKFFSGMSKQAIASKVKTLYELANPGTRIQVTGIDEQSGLYHVVLKAISPTGTTYREAYVTKDGKLLTEGVIYVENSTRSIKAFKDFVDCLYDKGLKIYGVLNRTQNPQGAIGTYYQLNMLGRYSGKLFVDCDGTAVKNCLQANVTRVPSVVFNGKIYSGVKTVDWFEKETGCKLVK